MLARGSQGMNKGQMHRYSTVKLRLHRLHYSSSYYKTLEPLSVYTAQGEGLATLVGGLFRITVWEEEAIVPSLCSHNKPSINIHTCTPGGSLAIPLEPGPSGYQLCHIVPWLSRLTTWPGQDQNTSSLWASFTQGVLHPCRFQSSRTEWTEHEHLPALARVA